MPRIDPKRVERAFREAQSREFWLDIKRGGGAALLLLVLALVMLLVGSPERVVGRASGMLVGSHQIQSEDGGGRVVASVRLDDGSIINVRLLRTDPILRDRRVILERLRRDWPPRSVRYRFAGYEERAPAPWPP